VVSRRWATTALALIPFAVLGAGEAYMQRRFTREMERLVLESPEFRQAMLDYEALQREYREARERGRSRR
jgi:hypothetical protein